MSKTKLKKLQKLEEERQKKLLQVKSIEILQKHKISEDAYSLLHASRTIGQVETLEEKRRLVYSLDIAAVQGWFGYS
ncbi:ATP-dependent RNA helicase DEAH13-like [Panicum virgatum]|uniref:ATP-dependent RNA helicase DEAH13-like n=1 Tax=Panicum virgatum TaxID=38727 RepID=UPI0019D5690E|nr:ATP-dependent RNA helicase DEAH13-like [Panicum virgatum]